MTDIQISIQYEDPDFFRALQSPEEFLPILGDSMEHILDVYEVVASEYAPESEANRPGRVDNKGRPMSYYERGRGTWIPILAFIRPSLREELPTLRLHGKAPKTLASIALAAEGIPGVTAYELIGGSEQMHDRWEIGVGINGSEVVGFLRNRASYSNEVQGAEQNPLHGERGWKTVEQSWEDGRVQDALFQYTAQALNHFYKLGV